MPDAKYGMLATTLRLEFELQATVVADDGNIIDSREREISKRIFYFRF